MTCTKGKAALKLYNFSNVIAFKQDLVKKTFAKREWNSLKDVTHFCLLLLTLLGRYTKLKRPLIFLGCLRLNPAPQLSSYVFVPNSH